MQNQIEPYEDRTAKLQTKANKALIAGIHRDWKAIEAAATAVGSQQVIGVNRMRACGEKLKALCGHEQLSAEFYNRVAGVMPKSMTYVAARGAVHISNRIQADVTTVQEALAVQRDFFAALGDFREPKRIGVQSGHDENPWSELVSGVASLTTIFGRLSPSPMSAWPKEQLQVFIEKTLPVVEKHEEAKRLLA